MKIFEKRSSDHGGDVQNAVPGVFVLLQQTRALAKQERMLLAGYAAWVILPALATFLLTFAEISSFWNSVSTNLILVADILVGIWVNACLVLVAMSRLRKEPLEDREVSTRARISMPVLLYLFAFSLFCIIAGTYLLILPGIVAFVWLAFADVAALEKPGANFSQAISRSKKLSEGRFFKVLWRLFAGNFVFGLAYFVLCLIVLGGVLFAAGINPTNLANDVIHTGSELPAWISLLLTALSLPFLPYTAIYTVALYDALKKT